MNFKFLVLLSLVYVAKSQNSTCQQSSLDIIMVIDASGSVGATNFELAKNACVKMAENLNIGPTKVKVGVIVYSSGASMISSLIDTDQNKANLINKIKNLPYSGGSTATGDALNMANLLFSKFGRTLTPRVVVLFTDGYSNSGTHNVYTTADTLKNGKVSIFSIGIGSGINRLELEKIADKPYSKYVKMVNDYSQLYQEINEITKFTCEVPAFIDINKKADLKTEKNEVRNLQVDLSKITRSSASIIELEITDIKGHTEQTVNWLFNNSKSIANLAHIKRSKKLNKFGKSVWTYWYPIDPNAERMYLKMVGTESENSAEILISTF